MGIENRDNGSVILTGYIDVPDARRDAVREALPEHIRLTRAEPGCVMFEVTENTSLPGRFDVRERFSDSIAFEAHQKRAQATEWARITDGIPRHYTITGLKE